jgi:hypothetical protein
LGRTGIEVAAGDDGHIAAIEAEVAEEHANGFIFDLDEMLGVEADGG